jgi:predicted DNA-binding helix-hairpin-helix protein
METFEKVRRLGEAAKFDKVCQSCDRIASGSIKHALYPAKLSQGGVVVLLKTLLTNICSRECSYCGLRASKYVPEVSFSPEELAKLFHTLSDRGYVQGLFLSSGEGVSVKKTFEDMIKTVEIIRYKYKYKGYIHLKILPTAPYSYIEEAVKLATRVSINLEAPTQKTLAEIAHRKDWNKDILLRMRWAKKLLEKEDARARSLTSQLVVGAAGESDTEILKTAAWLYRHFGVARVYYSAFQPLKGTPLEAHPPTSPLREYRLYQADFLIRKYGFQPEELFFSSDNNLLLTKEPKLAWAESHPEFFPVEINKAPYPVLLRVPGIGPKTASRILTSRIKSPLRTLGELKGLGGITKRAYPYITFNGKLRKRK